MTEKFDFADELKIIHEADAWHGPALQELLAGVTAEQAAARPIPNAHSIWELISHITAWENVVCLRLEGRAVDEPEEGDFPPVEDTSEDAWKQTLNKLNATHARFIERVASLSEANLGEAVEGRTYTVDYQLRSAVRHHVYHAGQIALLKKALVQSA
jgi:uncharacterized damage-inducible protein DinB